MDSVVSTTASAGPFSILAWAYEYLSSILGCPWPCTLFDKSYFSLDTLGVAGILGGDEAMSAMAAVHVYENRRWLGWYNSPGSYQIANQFRLLSKSRLRDNSSPDVHTDPVTWFGLGAPKGPKFRATQSGTIIEKTGHLASLFMNECADLEGKVVKGRRTQSVGITIAELKPAPPSQLYPRPIKAYSSVFASIPIVVSVCTCVACGVCEDWYSSLLILGGILASGLSCLTIGSGKFVFTHPDAPKGCPAGDGILGSDTEIVLLKGAEGAVNSITRGRFSLHFASEWQYQFIRWSCYVLLNTQFFTQLLLLPHGSAFGQIMFATSLVVSWVYISWLSPLDKEGILRDILFNTVLERPLTKYSFGTRTAAVVFILLVLQPEDPAEILDELLPNHTEVWRKWKGTIVSRLLCGEKLVFVQKDWVMVDGFTGKQKDLLEKLYGDAEAAYHTYEEYRDSSK